MLAGPKLRRLAARVCGALLALAIGIVVFQTLRRDGPAALAAWRGARVRWSFIWLATGCGFAGHLVYVLGWRRLLRDSSIAVGISSLLRMFFVSNLGRYLPGGKAWQMSIIGIMSAEARLPAATVAASSLLQGVIGVGVGAFVLFVAGGSAFGLQPAWIAMPLLGIIGVIAAPALLRRIPRWRATVVRLAPSVETVSVATMWALVWTSLVSWLLWGAALYFLGGAVLRTGVAPVLSCVAAWSGSFLAGLLAIVAPAGLGARESVMQVVLERAGMRAGDVLLVVVVARGWITLMDIVPAVVVLGIRSTVKRDVASEDQLHAEVASK